ncbi:hypothetical protein [Hymenobacter guriensis]|uniref:Outer membrane protein beta-barrel domain-containing protein n=1 Tax=Hymenobacter guriensis TaxID=2793065 RepID=A0ABS0L1W9_9BACT|nr:hypothetical protein [Hymenobacter guriensis]MBG8554106.1 hypothetical protein [Hymenobacter guriensis]
MTRILILATLLGATLSASHTAAAQDAAPWKVYLEGGGKVSAFRTTSYGGSYQPQGTYPSPEEDRKITVRNTFSGFLQVKGFKEVAKRLTLSGTVGLDMQHLNYRTGYTETFSNGTITAYGRDHISRLLSRARVDIGFYYPVRIGESGRLLPGIALGQMVNLSEQGYSYTFLQPGIYFTNDRLLLSATVSETPYNVLIPGASHMEGQLRGTYTYDAEYRIREFQLGFGAKF